MAVSDNKSLKERQKRDIKTWNAYKKRNEILKKNVEELCQAILSKSKSEAKLGKISGWQSEDLLELIKRSNATFNDILNSMANSFRTVQRKAEDTNRDFEDAKEQIQILIETLKACGVSDENIDDIMKSPKAEKLLKELRENQPEYIQKAMDSGIVQPKNSMSTPVAVQDETSDHVPDIDDILNNADAIDPADEARINAHTDQKTLQDPHISETPTTPAGSKIRAEYQEKAAEAAKAAAQTIESLSPTMDDRDWFYIQTLAESGLSIKKDIDNYLLASKKLTQYAIDSKFSNLQSHLVIMSMDVKVTGKTKFVKLTPFGVGMYCSHFKKKPEDVKQNLWDKLKAQHDNLEHGYGIYLLANLLKKTEIFADVQMFDIPAIELSKTNKGSKYKPDIICTEQNNEKMYIEYERDNHKQSDFSDKCSKMKRVTNTLNFVIPNKQAVDGMTAKIKRWIMEYGQQRLTGITIRLTTFGNIDENTDLRQDSNWDYVWHAWKSMEPTINI